jgi:hypothetical protein
VEHGLLSVETAIEKMAKVMTTVTEDDSRRGRCVDWKGETVPP